ncbi:MAG TPA: AAA family ATPase [Prolixibacteraceae bacterium]|nr:AAA family ATPase [Prolixibacteraceae bacterium]
MHNDDEILEQFLQEWPLERVERMTLEEYTNIEKTSFCYWLESQTQNLGSIWGGSSFKFGIFKRFDTSKVETRAAYKSEGVYAWVGKYGKTKTEAFEKVRSIIIETIKLSQKKEFEKIDKIDLGTAYKWKIAFMYSNLSLLPIFKEEMLRNIVKNRGLKVEKSFYKLQQRLLEQKAADTDIFNYANQLLEEIKPALEDSEKADHNPLTESVNHQSYWLYSPGPKAIMWEEFYSQNIVGLDLDSIGDLKNYPDKSSIAKKLQELSNLENPGSMSNDALAGDDFANNISVGDIIIVKSGITKLLGYGIVTSEYRYDSNRLKYKSIREVEWKLKGNWTTDFKMVLKTLTDITKYKSDLPEYNFYYERLLAIMGGTYTTFPQHANKVKHSLNQILFGPPGTGKTYNSINHALAIVERKDLETIENESNENRPEILRRFQAYVDSGQIVFTTFHQSMSYEDFIEGIKPTEVKGQLIFDIKKCVFRLLVDEALINYKNSLLQTGNKLFETVWGQFLLPLNEEEPIGVKMKMTSYTIVRVNEHTIFFDKNSGESKHTLSIKTLKSMYDAGENQIITGGLQPYYEALLKPLLAAGKESGKVEQKNYVIIIDEINRGNVAQIFGELITLIETDKRFGNKEALTVTLPYSKKKDFSIPLNLYIIGTMNTADRSVEALDTALRRRFTFIEMPPKYDLPELENEIIDGISLEMIMKTLNTRVEKLLDKDHLLGHSYFLCVDDIADLKRVFQQNIIPLLQEYFYGDFAKIGLVLGEAFFEKVEIPTKTIFATFTHDAQDELNEKPVYRLKQSWTEGEFEKAIKEMVNPLP